MKSRKSTLAIPICPTALSGQCTRKEIIRSNPDIGGFKIGVENGEPSAPPPLVQLTPYLEAGVGVGGAPQGAELLMAGDPESYGYNPELIQAQMLYLTTLPYLQ